MNINNWRRKQWKRKKNRNFSLQMPEMAGYKMQKGGMSIVIQWLRFHVPSSEGTGSIPGWETKIPHAVWPKKKKKDRGYRKKMTRCWQSSELVILKLPCTYSIM